MKLDDARALAERALSSDPRGHLPLPSRQQVLAALGHRLPRARLAINCARRALPGWEAAWPGDRLPHRLLEAAERALGAPDAAARALLQGESLTELDDRSSTSQGHQAVLAGYAAFRALAVALEDEPFDPAHLDPSVSDEERDPFEHDAGYLAAIAIAGGAPWEAGSSSVQRRDFWQWWLREAVPAAAAVNTR